MTNHAETEAIKSLRGLASDRSRDVKISAAQGLARYVHNPEAIKILTSLASDRSSDVKSAAAKALGGRI